MKETIGTIGFESPKRIGKLELVNKSILIICQDEDFSLPLTFKNQNEFYYVDFIENVINSFKNVCHVVKSNGTETDVIVTLFLSHEKEIDLLKGYLDDLNKRNKEMKRIHPSNGKGRTEVIAGKGWLSRRI